MLCSRSETGFFATKTQKTSVTIRLFTGVFCVFVALLQKKKKRRHKTPLQIRKDKGSRGVTISPDLLE